MTKIIVLDYCTGDAFITTVPAPAMDEQVSEKLDTMGRSMSDCYYMTLPDDATIEEIE